MPDTNDLFSSESDKIIKDGFKAVDEMRRYIATIERSRDEQPALLAKAREDADEARGWALIEEPWETLITAIPAYTSDGQRTGSALHFPSIIAKELFGARLAFDMLDCGDDSDRLEEVKTRYFTELKGDTGLLFLIFAAALDTIASIVVPQMLEDLELHGSNYEARVMLAKARGNAWRGRVSELREVNAGLEEQGVKPVDGYDIGMNSFDPEAPL